MTTLNRRQFLAGAATLAGMRAAAFSFDPQDPIASSAPVRWAAGRLDAALAQRQLKIQVIAAGRSMSAASAPSLPDVPEVCELANTPSGVLAAGSDVRGLVYALLEAADRVEHGDPPAPAKPLIQRPANRIRS